MAYPPRTLETFTAYFWSRVDKGEDDACWDWLGSTVHGYGQIFYLGKQRKAHRIASELADGPILDGAHVLHRCDNRRCCNPKHLFRGSAADNIADMIAKGRSNFTGARGLPGQRGEKNGRAKLTAEAVTEIRATAARRGRPGVSHMKLAEKFGVSHPTIGAILCGRNWKSD